MLIIRNLEKENKKISPIGEIFLFQTIILKF
jgi:hypothetical protein